MDIVLIHLGNTGKSPTHIKLLVISLELIESLNMKKMCSSTLSWLGVVLLYIASVLYKIARRGKQMAARLIGFSPSY